MAAEVEKVVDELHEMENARDDLLEELDKLVKAMDDNLPLLDALKEDPNMQRVERAIKFARLALERHSA